MITNKKISFIYQKKIYKIPIRYISSHIFTDNEQNICNEKSTPYIHYSGKYAAKEAVKKALLSSQVLENISLKLIEIKNDIMGAPMIDIKSIKIDPERLKVSISHAGEYAIATAILEI